MLLALLGLAVALLSRTAQAEMRRFVAKRFYRSSYDYREKWLEVTDAFEACRTADAILDRLLDVVARTFGTGHISVWMRFEADERFHQVRSINVEAAPPPMASSHPLVRALGAAEGPLDVQGGRSRARQDGWMGHFRRSHAGRSLCARAFAGRDHRRSLPWGRSEAGKRYGTDDRNLLRAITHHAGVLLVPRAPGRGAARRRRARGLAPGLGFLRPRPQEPGGEPVPRGPERRDPRLGSGLPGERAQDRRAHRGQDHGPRAPALSRRSDEGVAPQRDRWTSAQAVDETLASLDGALRANGAARGRAGSSVAATKDELHQVLLNLVLNAADALAGVARLIGGREGIVVRTAREGERVILSVADSGPGLHAETLQTLFQPFRTTKIGGLGLGLYECKRIVEAQRGRIRVRSEPGRGTEFVVELPIWAEARDRP